jgi:hypothetical protein
VREHVVHLARDPAPLGVARLLDPQALLGLHPDRAVAQRAQVLAPHPDQQAPADHDGRAERPEYDVEQVGVPVGIDPREQLEDDDADQHDGPDRPLRAAQRDVEPGDQPRAGGQRGDAARDADDDPDLVRVRAAPPQQDEAGHAEHEVDCQQRVAVGIPRVDQREHPGADRDQVHRRVDEPVARGAAAVRLVAQLARQQLVMPALGAHGAEGYGRGRLATPYRSRCRDRPTARAA